MADRTPNILLITSDQQRGDCFGFEGRNIHTPHLDQLARDGTRFATCITPSLVCQPARASLLTGLLPLTHGVWDNGIDLRDEVADLGFAAELSRQGYHTGLVGKAHFSTYHTFEATGRPECRQSTHLFDEGWHGPYMGFDEVEIVLAGHNTFLPMKPPHGLHYEAWYHHGGKGDALDEAYGRRMRPDTGAAQTHHSGLPPTWHNSTWVADRTIAFLERNKDRPFCLWASFPDPHHPFDCPVPWSLLHPPESVDLPVHRELDLDRRPAWHRQSLESKPVLANERLRRFREEGSRVVRQSEAQLREMIANYYGMISLIDHNVGRIMAGLQAAGLSDNTIVIYTSDHGDLLGDHGLYLKGPTPYDGLLRVGLIAAGPDVPVRRVVDDPVSLMDLCPTIHDLAGVGPAMDMHGQSLLPLVQGGGERTFACSEWKVHPSRCGVALDLRTVRTKRHRLTVERESGEGELYDFVNDPAECDNLWQDPGAAAVRKELLDLIEARPDDMAEPLPEPIGMA